MSGGKSTTYANNVLTYLLTTATAPTRPSSLTIALYTDNGTTAPTTELTSASSAGYARQTVSFGSTAATGKSISNTTEVTFTATGGPWQTAASYAILDQSGAQIYFAPLSTSRTLQVSGDKLDFAIGSISVSEA